ncbi:MAG TPA: T9SS type A sorting domain-containing protein, partial [Parafilimonas sp.]|nr:T9SS type A sorting domain-containing protein [Parafilimonas sp.]
GITDFNKFAVVNGTDIVLPLAITDLKAWRQGSCVNLLWRSQHESNTDHYEIQNASEAKEFRFVGTAAAKNAPFFNDYSFIDEHPLAGMNYYRIKVVDKNGHESYSSVVFIDMPQTMNQVSIYPNPVQGSVIRIFAPNVKTGNYWLEMYDRIGRKIFKKEIEYSGTSVSEEIILPSAVAAGLYEIILRNDKEILMKSFLVVVR